MAQSNPASAGSTILDTHLRDLTEALATTRATERAVVARLCWAHVSGLTESNDLAALVEQVRSAYTATDAAVDALLLAESSDQTVPDSFVRRQTRALAARLAGTVSAA